MDLPSEVPHAGAVWIPIGPSSSGESMFVGLYAKSASKPVAEIEPLLMTCLSALLHADMRALYETMPTFGCHSDEYWLILGPAQAYVVANGRFSFG
jgi:hypothetical protein